MRARGPRVAPSAVVTGGAGGLGLAFTAALATAGYDVIPVDVRDTERTLDVTDPAACRALADDVQPVVWVNNAGLTGRGDVLDQTDAEIEAMVAVNLLGVIHGSRAAARSMLAGTGGTILNIASLAGWAPTPHIAAYSATKHGVRAFSVAFAAELRRTSVAVRCLLPDGIRTPMVDVDDPRQLMSFTGRRLLEPSEVAAAGMRLLRSGRLLGSVPPRRGVTPRLLGLSPGLSLALQRPVERRARPPPAPRGCARDRHMTAAAVFVTGALGFIGSAVADSYRDAGADVRGVDMRADQAHGIVAGDISSPGDWQAHMAGCDLVVHTAALGVERREPGTGVGRKRARHAPCPRRRGRSQHPAARSFLLGRGVRARSARSRRRATSGSNDWRGVRRHEGCRRAGRPPGARSE